MTHPMRRTVLAVLLLVPIAVVTGCGGCGCSEAKKPPVDQPTASQAKAASPDKTAPAEKPHVAITISKETTGVTEPLRENGYVDYLALLNQRSSHGVTPENNAAVLFWTAVGPEEIRPADRPQYFQMLGISPLPQKEACFAHLDKYLTRSKDSTRNKYGKLKGRMPESISPLLHPAMKRPWSKPEFAELAGQLEALEKPLLLVAEASKRPRRYDPLLTEKPGIISVFLFPAVLQYHDAAEALLARAMLRIGESKPAAAWDDLLTCHRLARLIGQGPTLSESLIAVDLDEMACVGDQVLLQQAKLTAAELAGMRENLKQLAPLPKLVDRIDAAERFAFLDGIALVAREGIAAADKLTEDHDSEGEKSTSSFVSALAGAMIDWNHVLRTSNTWYDQIVDAYRKPARAERKKAIDKVEKEIGKQANAASGWTSMVVAAVSNPKQLYMQEFAKVFTTKVLPADQKSADAVDRGIMRFELDKLGFALAAYRAEHGSYPAKLAELKPKYVAEISKDIFTDGELHYRQEGAGYLLYSVGANGKDDGAKSYDDRKGGEDWDDLVIRMAAPK